jgi:hypothetical protein
VQNDVRHDTCYRMQLGQNDVSRPHRHEGYERRLVLFPRIQQKSKGKRSSSSSAHLMTSFDGDGVGLTFVFGDSRVDAVYDIGSNGGFEDCGERDCGAIGGCRARSEDVDLWTSGLAISTKFHTNFEKRFHRPIHHKDNQ